MINRIDLGEIKTRFASFLASNSINPSMFDFVEFLDSADNEDPAIRLDLFMDKKSSRFIVFETGDTSVEVIDSKTNEDIVFDNYEKLTLNEIIEVFEETIERYHL